MYQGTRVAERRRPWCPEPLRNPSEEMLEGIASIAEYIGRNYWTARRYILYHGLPATKLPSGRWFTTKHLIDQWIFVGHKFEVARVTGICPVCKREMPEEDSADTGNDPN